MDEAEAVATHGERRQEAADGAVASARTPSPSARRASASTSRRRVDDAVTRGADERGGGGDGAGDGRRRRAGWNGARRVSASVGSGRVSNRRRAEQSAAAWLALRESGRYGRAAHPPGSAAGAAALPHPGLVALGDALAADESLEVSDAASTRGITTAASELRLLPRRRRRPIPSVPARGSSAGAPRRRRRTWRATRRSRRTRASLEALKALRGRVVGVHRQGVGARARASGSHRRRARRSSRSVARGRRGGAWSAERRDGEPEDVEGSGDVSGRRRRVLPSGR